MKFVKDCLAGIQHAMGKAKMMADSGEMQHREMANEMLSSLATMAQKCTDAMGGQGAAMMQQLAQEQALATKGAALLVTLAQELGTSDPDEIESKILGLKDKASDAGKVERAAVLKLLSDNAQKIPPARVDGLKGKSVKFVETYLTTLGDSDLPTEQVRETKPVDPSAAELAKVKKAADDAAAAAGGSIKLLTLGDLNVYEKDALDNLLNSRKANDGDKFDEKALETAFLTSLTEAKKGA